MKKKLILMFISILMLNACKKQEKTEAEKIIDQNALRDSIVLEQKKSQIVPILDSIISKNKFNGIVSVEWDQKKIYERAQGFSNFERQTNIDNQTVFPIASNSKQFTGVLILQLEEQQKLSLNDTVSKYLKSFQTPSYKGITISELLHHSSGINYFGEKLMFKPGTDFHYSNDAYKSLGDIIEVVTGKSYDENVMALFQKLGMRHSSTGNLYSGTNFASAHLGKLNNPKEVPNMPKRLDKNHISIAAGGILSTVDDLHLWNNALYNGKVLTKESFKIFIKPEKSFEHYILGKVGYACGIMISPKSPQTYMHSGYVKGAPSLNFYYPETKTSVIILSNIADESLGKKAIYKTHRQIRIKIDSLTTIWNQDKKNVLTNL
ncbi:serine hydrolase domain-containing protein [Soonwooa purpurea]